MSRWSGLTRVPTSQAIPYSAVGQSLLPVETEAYI